MSRGSTNHSFRRDRFDPHWDDAWEEFKAAADATGTTTSALIRDLIRHYLGRGPRPKRPAAD